MINAKLLQHVIDASNDGIVVAEQEGEDTILIYVNPAFERLTGYSSHETLYQDCRFLQNGTRDEQALGAIRQAIENGLPSRTILKNFRKDGTAFWNELSITPVRNEAHQLTYFIGVQKDVTEQVECRQRLTALEQELAEARAEIQALRADRRS